jgi:hypothetical protein
MEIYCFVEKEYRYFQEEKEILQNVGQKLTCEYNVIY